MTLVGHAKNTIVRYISTFVQYMSRRLTTELKLMGFVVNPYDPCIANKIVDRHQLRLRWHVDDLMISHIDMSAIKQHDKLAQRA